MKIMAHGVTVSVGETIRIEIVTNKFAPFDSHVYIRDGYNGECHLVLSSAALEALSQALSVMQPVEKNDPG